MDQPVPNLRHLSGILTIARTGTVSDAASRINLSQPALTQGLQKIEARLGVALFQRSSDGMHSTEAGALYLGRLDRGFRFLRSAARSVDRPHLWRLVSVGQLRALIATVDHAGFRPAAAHLDRRVSTVSRACREIESLGRVAFFETTSRGLRPTRQAEAFARHAQLALNEFVQAERDVMGWQGTFEGRLDIGCLPLMQTIILPTALSRFAAEYPSIAPRIADGPYAPMARGLLRGNLDLIVGALRGGDLPDGLVQTELFADHLWIVGRPEHPLAGRQRVAERDLEGFQWVAPREGAPARAHFAQLHARLATGPEQPQPIETGSYAVVKGLLAASDRLSILSAKQVKHDVDGGRLARIDVTLPDSGRAIGYTHRADWLPSVPQARFLEILTEVAQSS